MKLSDMSKEEIELLSYTDLTNLLLKEKKKAMNTPSIFKEICQLLDYSDADYANKIGDYYTSLTIDKRFVLLENNEWDLRDHHSVELVVDDDEEEEVEETEEAEEEEEPTEEEEDIDAVVDDEEIDDVDDEMEDLSLIEEEEETEEES